MSSKDIKKAQYYVEYLGWKEARGLYGREFTEPIVRELLLRRRLNELPRLTLKLSKKELNISQELDSDRRKPEKVKYPPIPSKDITYVSQSPQPDNDVVSCIFLGYNPLTKCAVHVHAYRFDSESSASLYAQHIKKILDMPEYRERIIGIERDLAEHGHIIMRRATADMGLLTMSEPPPDYGPLNNGHTGYKIGDDNSDGSSWKTPSPETSHSDNSGPVRRYPPAAEVLLSRPDIKIEKKQTQHPDVSSQRMFNHVQEELEHKLKIKGPILLPPKDYNTILRKHGHLEVRDERKSYNSRIVGPNSIFANADPGQSFSSVDSGSCASNETENTGESGADFSMSQSTTEWSKPVMKRSSSEIPTNGGHLRRQNSKTSDFSYNSDELAYADGIYTGFNPASTKANGSPKPHSMNNNAVNEMVMWSTNYTFNNQEHVVKSQGASYRHENDPLARTAPSGVLYRHSIPRSGGEHQPVRISKHQRRASNQLRDHLP